MSHMQMARRIETKKRSPLWLPATVLQLCCGVAFATNLPLIPELGWVATRTAILAAVIFFAIWVAKDEKLRSKALRLIGR